MTKKHGYHYKIRLGVGGGITDSSSWCIYNGADFITTGSINQCSVEADISVSAKEMLSGINVQDTGYAPSWDLYETSSKVQVLKKEPCIKLGAISCTRFIAVIIHLMGSMN